MFLTENRLWAGESGNFFPWTVNSLLNICILNVFNQPLKQYFQIALNHFLIVSVTTIRVLLFCRLLHIILKIVVSPFPPVRILLYNHISGVSLWKEKPVGSRLCVWVFQQRPQETGDAVLHTFHPDVLTSPI